MLDATSSGSNLKLALAAQFASRPTLRDVASTQIISALIEQYPMIATTQPQLTSADALRVMQPKQADVYDAVALVDLLLDALRSNTPLEFPSVGELRPYLSLNPPHYLYVDPDPDPEAGTESDRVSLDALSAALNDVLLLLPSYFCQAQTDYWAADGGEGITRDVWLQQALRLELLRNLPLQGLEEPEQQAVRGLIRGGKSTPNVAVIEVHLKRDSTEQIIRLPDLLIEAQLDERSFMLWCAPSSVVRAFDASQAFGQALAESLALHYRFEDMTWNRYELVGDPFATQVALMLEASLAAVADVRLGMVPSTDALEQVYAGLSDPARWLLEGYAEPRGEQLQLPPGLVRMSAQTSFAYRSGLIELGLAQADAAAKTPLDDVLDLTSYTRQKLREQMLADHPDDANYFSDDLVLTLSIARGNPGGAGAGVGGGTVEHVTESLTKFAIGNLSSLGGATVTAVSHTQDQLIMDWMNPEYVQALVETVDIGGTYPGYVDEKLKEAAEEPGQVKRFAQHWRTSLLFSALSARLGDTLSENGLQAMIDYCRGHLAADEPAVALLPLAFNRAGADAVVDTVTGMYVLFAAEAETVVLYRPLYGQEAISEFASIKAMMQAIGEASSLQESVLDWLPAGARPFYADGGFTDPHAVVPVLDIIEPPEAVDPPTVNVQYWLSGVDQKLYEANRKALVELADRQSVSNAESRWALLAEGAWLLFNVVTLELRGPVATVAWLVQGILALKSDIEALESGTEFERSAAAVDLLLNAGMALLHGHLPAHAVPDYGDIGRHAACLGPLQGEPVLLPAVLNVSEGQRHQSGVLAEQPGLQVDLSHRDSTAFKPLSEAQSSGLQAYRADISLDGVEPISEGIGKGLYLVGETYYVKWHLLVYQVSLTDGVVHIGDTSTALTNRDGNWRVDRRLRLLGGMPKSRIQKMREENAAKKANFISEDARLAEIHGTLHATFAQHRQMLVDKEAEIKTLEEVLQPDAVQQDQLATLKALRARMRETTVTDLRAVINHEIHHDAMLISLAAMTIPDQAFEGDVKLVRSTLRQQLLDNCESYYNEMAISINQAEVRRLRDAMAVHPESDAEKAEYTHFLEIVEKVAGWEIDLIDFAREFDRLLMDTLADDRLTFTNEKNERIGKDQQLRRIIETRSLNAVDLSLAALEDLAELSINRLTTEADEELLQQYSSYLYGQSVRSAGASHADLAGSPFSAEERVQVLTSVLEGYEEAASMADYLSSVGDSAINKPWLIKYKKVLSNLQEAARAELAAELKELELALPPPKRTPVYRPRGGVRRVVRTHRGRSVVAEETEVDGAAVVQQRDARTELLNTFMHEGGQWVEDSASSTTSPPVSSRQLSATRQNARRLLDQIPSVYALAKRYGSNEPLGLTTVIEQHSDKLREVLEALPRTPEDEALRTDVETGLSQLESNQRELLKSLYLTSTHPTAGGLKFLHKEQALVITRVGKRKKLSALDFLDVYRIDRAAEPGQAKPVPLWEAHFHYPAMKTPGRDFSQGHLKTWLQRGLGWADQIRAAADGDVLEIYRGKLSLADLEGIISFDE